MYLMCPPTFSSLLQQTFIVKTNQLSRMLQHCDFSLWFGVLISPPNIYQSQLKPNLEAGTEKTNLASQRKHCMQSAIRQGIQSVIIHRPFSCLYWHIPDHTSHEIFQLSPSLISPIVSLRLNSPNGKNKAQQRQPSNNGCAVFLLGSHFHTLYWLHITLLFHTKNKMIGFTIAIGIQ